MNQSVSWNAIRVLNVVHFLFKRVYTLLFPSESGENKITFVLIGFLFRFEAGKRSNKRGQTGSRHSVALVA